jgi:hypothetical protein
VHAPGTYALMQSHRGLLYCPKVLLTPESALGIIGVKNERNSTHEKILFNHLHPQSGVRLRNLHRVRNQPGWYFCRGQNWGAFDR